MAGVRGLEETGANVDTKARDYAAAKQLAQATERAHAVERDYRARWLSPSPSPSPSPEPPQSYEARLGSSA